MPQVGLSRGKREANVQDAFRPRAGAAPGRRSVLIDDVQTTGATLEEAAKALLAAGAHQVYALTLCWDGTAGKM
jgi:predicted amidophosphoribosyltransferase